MRPLFDDLDEFAFGDSGCRPHTPRTTQGGASVRKSEAHDSPDDDEYLDDMDEYEDYEDYSDYNEDEFDEHSGVDTDH